MIQEKISTIMVRIAVATVESVFRIPHFARIDVTPAKNAEPNIILRIFQKLKLKKLVNLRFTSSVNSPCWTRTNDTAVNSRMLYRLS